MAAGRCYERWLLPGGPATRQAEEAARRVAGRLVKALLPHARARVVVFAPRGAAAHEGREAPEIQVLVHFTAELVYTVAVLAKIVREQRLRFVARGLEAGEHHWRARLVVAGDRFATGESVLCVGARELWVRYTSRHWFDDTLEVIETEPVALDAIVPIDLLSHVEVRPVEVGLRVKQRQYAKRLQGLLDAERALEIAEHAYGGVGENDLAESPSQLLSLWRRPGQDDVIRSVRTALTDIAERL